MVEGITSGRYSGTRISNPADSLASSRVVCLGISNESMSTVFLTVAPLRHLEYNSGVRDARIGLPGRGSRVPSSGLPSLSYISYLERPPRSLCPPRVLPHLKSWILLPPLSGWFQAGTWALPSISSIPSRETSVSFSNLLIIPT